MFTGNLHSVEYWANSKFGKLRMETPIEISPGSSTKSVTWLCDCGRKISKPVFWVSNGKTSTCGKCDTLNKEYWANSKFGKLRMETPIEIHKYSNEKVHWICDCGKKLFKSINKVTSGDVTKCGRCDFLSIEYLTSNKFGKLRMETPAEIHKGSAVKVSWLCDCGNKTLSGVGRVTSGITSSCGKCNWLSIEYWANSKFGKLKMETPCYIAGHSMKKVSWLCDCGRKNFISVHHVFSGLTRSCGKCNLKSIEYWANSKFGKLKMETPVEISSGSSVKTSWICHCGQKTIASIAQVTRGNKKSCGNCHDKATEWFNMNEKLLLSLKTPFQCSQVPNGWIQILDNIKYVKTPIKSVCGACGSDYYPIWKDIRKGRSLTCGCTTYRISKPNKEIGAHVESLGFEILYEQKIGSYKYDISIPSKKLLIEMNGLRCHSFKDSKRRDIDKYKNAISSGYQFISIFEDEWANKKEIICDVIRNRLNSSHFQSIRPSSCDIRLINSKSSHQFYDKHHYIGSCHSSINYGVFLDGKMLCCVSFKKPTRQSRYQYELVRMVSDPEYRIHGIWSKVLKKFHEDYEPSSIVSFSDNRLFNGEVYKKIGFRFDGEIKPDYYWVKGLKRFHKSGLRKKKEELLTGKTESELRELEGYRKIWDLGKKRWVTEYV